MMLKDNERKFGIHIVTKLFLDHLTNEPVPSGVAHLSMIDRTTYKIYGESWRITFENGYGASIIRHATSYGGDIGLFEVAVLHNDELCYDTPITPDVLGYLSEDGVTEVLDQIAQLEPSHA